MGEEDSFSKNDGLIELLKDRLYWGYSSVAERLLRMLKVTGSTPVVSKNFAV